MQDWEGHTPDILAGWQPLGPFFDAGQGTVPFAAKTLKIGIREGPGQCPVLMV
jgi:hypothetical protein